MLVYLQEMTSNLSRLLHSFATAHHLPPCTLQNNNNKLTNNVITDDDNNNNKDATTSTTTSPIALNWQLKSSEKQPFDIRLSFQPPALKAWWPLLGQLSHQLLSLFPVASATVLENRTLDIRLHRKRSIVGLLSSSSSTTSGPTTLPCSLSAVAITRAAAAAAALVLKVPSVKSASSHLARRRIDLVCSAVERLLKQLGTSVVVVNERNESYSNLDTASPPSPQEYHQNDDGIIRSSSSSTNERFVFVLVFLWLI